MNAVHLTVNLLSEQTCEGSSEMLHIYVQHCLGAPYSVVAHAATRHFCISQMLIPMHHRFVNQCCLVQVHLIKLAVNTGVRYQICKPQNTIYFLFHKIDLFN